VKIKKRCTHPEDRLDSTSGVTDSPDSSPSSGSNEPSVGHEANVSQTPTEGDFSDLSEWDFDFSDFQSPTSSGQTQQANGIPTLVQRSRPPQHSTPLTPALTSRALVRRPKSSPGLQRTSLLLHGILKSYPRMMSQHDNLPPFFHPHAFSLFADKDLMEPLSNCGSLVSLRYSSSKLFWRNVSHECERWCIEAEKWDQWALLAAIQSLLIYILIRLEEGETEHNNIDSLLIATVFTLCKHFNEAEARQIVQPALWNWNLNAAWKYWIYQESARRLCIVYQIINMLVIFEPVVLCSLHESDLVLSQLPSRRKLWEAGDEYAWQAASQRDVDVQSVYGVAAVTGDLVKVEDMGLATRSSAQWEDWCSGMDGMGGLVMLAASLVG
jgi:hypothetical protein